MQWHPKEADLPALLAKLCDAGVEFIVVGGTAAVFQGAPITTTDRLVEIVAHNTCTELAPRPATACKSAVRRLPLSAAAPGEKEC